MLPIPNNNALSSSNENDSDDFSIINSPSPQSANNNDKTINSKSISKIKESVEIDDFEHVSVANSSNSSTNKHSDNDDNDDNQGQSEFDIIDISSHGFQVIQESESDNDSKQNVASPTQQIPLNPPESDQIIQDNANNQISIDYVEYKLDALNVSPSPKSNATMEDIVTLTEPLNSSRSVIDDELIIDEGTTETKRNEEYKPLIDKIISTNMNKKKKTKYRQKEYQRYVEDKSNDTTLGCNGYFCCKMQSMQTEVSNTKNFFENISCITDIFSNYIDRCFGDDQFNDDAFQKKKTHKRKMKINQ